MVERRPGERRQAVRAESVLMSGGKDRVHLCLRQRPRRLMRPRAPVLESRFALGLIPPEPLPGGLAAHADGVGDGHAAHNEDPVDQQPPAEPRQLRPTMCHGSLPTVVSWIPTPSLGRLSLVNNQLVNHD
jgi:hypothetical protein